MCLRPSFIISVPLGLIPIFKVGKWSNFLLRDHDLPLGLQILNQDNLNGAQWSGVTVIVIVAFPFAVALQLYLISIVDKSSDGVVRSAWETTTFGFAIVLSLLVISAF